MAEMEVCKYFQKKKIYNKIQKIISMGRFWKLERSNRLPYFIYFIRIAREI